MAILKGRTEDGKRKWAVYAYLPCPVCCRGLWAVYQQMPGYAKNDRWVFPWHPELGRSEDGCAGGAYKGSEYRTGRGHPVTDWRLLPAIWHRAGGVRWAENYAVRLRNAVAQASAVERLESAFLGGAYNDVLPNVPISHLPYGKPEPWLYGDTGEMFWAVSQQRRQVVNLRREQRQKRARRRRRNPAVVYLVRISRRVPAAAAGAAEELGLEDRVERIPEETKGNGDEQQ